MTNNRLKSVRGFRTVCNMCIACFIPVVEGTLNAADPVQSTHTTHPADCAVNQLAVQSPQISLTAMRALDAFLAQNSGVSPLRDIYWSGSPEIVRMFRDYPQVFEAAKAALIELQPAIVAYLAGEGDRFIISQSLADRLSTIYDLLWQFGGPSLKPAVTKAREWFNSFQGLAGKTLSEVGPGFGFIPVQRPFVHLSGARLEANRFVLQANRVGNLHYSLWRASALSSADWTPVEGAEVKTAELTVELAISHSPGAEVYYQVRAENGGTAIALPSGAGNAFEFIDKSTQDGLTLRHVGYLAEIAGLTDADLFSDPVSHDERTARFTFAAETTIRQRHTLGSLIQTSADGSMTIYYNENPTGNFDQPETFSRGRAVAKMALNYSNTLTVLKENEGINAAAASFEVQESTPFAIGTRSLTWARPGVQGRIEAAGPGFRTVVEPVTAHFFLSGYGIIIQP